MKALRTLTSVGSSIIEAAGVEAAGIGLALVQGATVGVWITSGAWGTLAQEASVLIDTLGPSTARVTQTLVEVHTLKYTKSQIEGSELCSVCQNILDQMNGIHVSVGEILHNNLRI